MDMIALFDLDEMVCRQTAFNSFIDLVLCHFVDGYIPTLSYYSDYRAEDVVNLERYKIASCFTRVVQRMGSKQQAFMGSGDTIWFWNVDVLWDGEWEIKFKD